jgi:hypothetical protein
MAKLRLSVLREEIDNEIRKRGISWDIKTYIG